jgi:hypothetical protein
VVADYDHDGMPNDWEQSFSFNPVDPYDSINDPDSDGLSNLAEYKRGTNPLMSDTDGDTMKDGDELNVSRDPLVADQSPTGPVLDVGADKIGFTGAAGLSPATQNFWVTNGGIGDLNWTASADAPWIQLSVAQGAAPTEVTVSANIAGMAPGDYSGQITFTASGAAKSPKVVTAKLRIVEQAGGLTTKLYLPVISTQ